MSDERKLTECGAYWLKEAKDGTKFFSGNIDLSKLEVGPTDTIQLMVFRNKHKTKDNQPDYKISAVAPPKGESKADDDDAPF